MNKIKSFFSKLRECCPKPASIIFIIALISFVLKILFSLSETFSDFYNRYPGAFIRMITAKLTNWIPFSLAETIIMILPLIVIILIIKIIKVSKKSLHEMARTALSLLAVLAAFFSSFILSFSAGYSGTTLDEKLGIERNKVNAEDLYYTAEELLNELQLLKDDIHFNYGSSSVMPYSISEMNRRLQDAYKELAAEYDFIPSFYSKVKPIVLSEPMTYTHISGVYTYFTGESNLNTNFPDYNLPFTAAHELAHQRGIAREDEANFIAFLVCIKSEDPYIRYSGYMNIYEYVMSALYSADSKKYFKLIDQTDNKLKYEMIAYNKFFEKYSDNVIADISGSINDSYLSSQGQKEGSKSYGMVVDLTVAYYKKH